MRQAPLVLRPALKLLARTASPLVLLAPAALAETWNLGIGGSWGTPGNWNPATVPSATGASAIFNGAATGLNPAQTANRSITLDGTRTVGSLFFNNDLSTFTNSIATGTAGSLLVFDELGAGPAIITVPVAPGTGNNTISGAMSLTDSLVGVVNNTSATSGAGALNLTGAMSGAGGFQKTGDGLATFGTGAKTYTGPTVLSGGRMRISAAAAPTGTSSFTIDNGAQLELITAGIYNFGSGPLTLNGSGATSGPYAAFPGAIRPTTGLIYTIGNPVVLATDSIIHMQGAAAGSLTLSNVVSGPGELFFSAETFDANLGTLVLNSANTYLGGTTVNGGTLSLFGGAASLGTGDVVVESANSIFSGASAKLTIQSGVLDAIANTATLSLFGGNAGGVPDDGYIDLGAGVNEIVGALFLGGVPQLPGTYGSSASGAAVQNDEYFAGSGVVTVIPEPTAVTLLLAGALALGLRRRSQQAA